MTLERKFEFGSNLDPDGSRTGTLRELLEEINAEDRGGRASLKGERRRSKQTLRHTLRFVDGVLTTNLCDAGLEDPLPLLTLKAIKLLFRTNEKGGAHLFQLLSLDSSDKKPSVEFINYFASEARLKKVLRDLLETLKLEIDNGQLRLIEATLGTPNQLVDKIRRLSNRVLFILHPQPELRTDDITTLAQEVGSYHQTEQATQGASNTKSPPPAHEALFIYIHRIGFAHFVAEYKEIYKAAAIADPVPPIASDLQRFAMSLPPVKQESASDAAVGCKTPITSVNEFPHFVRQHMAAFRGFVEKATKKLDARSAALDKLVERAQKLLALSLIHNHQAELSDPGIGIGVLDHRLHSVVDCAAALCAINYIKRGGKDGYKPHIQGKRNQGKGAHWWLDDAHSVEDILQRDYVPHGLKLVLYRRYVNIHAALMGHSHVLSARLTFQLARADQYLRCMASNDVVIIKQAFDQFESFCEERARAMSMSDLEFALRVMTRAMSDSVTPEWQK